MRTLWGSLAAILLATATAHAEKPVKSKPAAATADGGETAYAYGRLTQRFHFQVGSYLYHYSEPGVMKIHGTMYSAQIGGRQSVGVHRVPMYYGFDLSQALGKQIYDGALYVTSGTTSYTIPSSDNSNDRITDLQAYFGVSLLNSATSGLDTWAGIGVWYLHNKIDGTGSYTREITYYYLHGDARYYLHPQPWFTFYTGAQIAVQAFGTVVSQLGEAQPGEDAIHNEQFGGIGTTVTVGSEFTFSAMSPYVEAYFRYWNVPDSTVEYRVQNGQEVGYKEPANNTTMVGLNLGTRF